MWRLQLLPIQEKEETKMSELTGRHIERQGTPAANIRLASCGVKCLNSSSVFQLGFSAVLTVLCPEIPHERQAQKRCT